MAPPCFIFLHRSGVLSRPAGLEIYFRFSKGVTGKKDGLINMFMYKSRSLQCKSEILGDKPLPT